MILIPLFGVQGLVLAQIFQQTFVIITGWLVLRRHIAGLGWFPLSWRTSVFKTTTGYALKLNLIAILGTLFDPLAKLGFNNIGGPAQVGLYELASRLIVQIRGLVVSAAMPLVPAIASRQISDTGSLSLLISKSTKMICLAALMVAVSGLAAAPFISWFMLNEISNDFLVISIALVFGWSVNLLGLGFYLAAQARGMLVWNIVSHGLIAALVLLAAVVLSSSISGRGLALMIGLALALSAVPVVVGNVHALDVRDSLKEARKLIVGCVVFLVLACAGMLFLAW
jgi:O-antigen/teichoic acid export membrane protein